MYAADAPDRVQYLWKMHGRRPSSLAHRLNGVWFENERANVPPEVRSRSQGCTGVDTRLCTTMFSYSFRS